MTRAMNWYAIQLLFMLVFLIKQNIYLLLINRQGHQANCRRCSAGHKTNALSATKPLIHWRRHVHLFSFLLNYSFFWQLIVSIIQLTMEGESYHKTCFKCAHGGCKLTTSNYAALDGVLYCKHHFAQLFKEKGSYNHLNKTASMKKNPELASGQEPETRTDTTEQQSTQNES